MHCSLGLISLQGMYFLMPVEFSRQTFWFATHPTIERVRVAKARAATAKCFSGCSCNHGGACRSSARPRAAEPRESHNALATGLCPHAIGPYPLAIGPYAQVIGLYHGIGAHGSGIGADGRGMSLWLGDRGLWSGGRELRAWG